jgi:hypothetical protein
MDSKETLTSAKYGEWMASLFGACIVAFALGIWLTDMFKPYVWVILVIGVALHGYGMLKMYKRNM